MTRHYGDWLKAYIEFANVSEAPTYMHFWSGVSAIAGALQRKVWFNMGRFKWYPNFYIVLVAPPGIVAKSTTIGVAMDILKQVKGVKFGPDIVTWPALVEKFADSRQDFEYEGKFYPMCAMTLESAEFGNLLDPRDHQMINLLVHLWDGKQGSFSKVTKGDSNEIINPWINKIACTTPQWIAENFPEYMIGGGYTSRVVFVYGDKKEKLIAYPFLEPDFLKFDEEGREVKLKEDLERIAKLVGPFTLTEKSIEWGKKWYDMHWEKKPINLSDARFDGYISRKQSHLHKLTMVLSASLGSSMKITVENLTTANIMITDLESDMVKVFSKIGKTDTSIHVDRLLNYIAQEDQVPYKEVYQYVHDQFPSAKDFEDVIAGCCKSGKLVLIQVKGVPTLKYQGGLI